MADEVKIFSDGEEMTSKVSLKSILVFKGVNRIPTANLTIGDGSASKEDFEHATGDKFIPGVEVEIKVGDQDAVETIFKGIITKQSIKIIGDDESILSLEIKDESIKMTIGRKSKYFEEMTDSDIIEEIVSEYGLDTDIEATNVTHAEMVQHHVTDWDFIVSRAEVNGMLVFVSDGEVAVKAPDLSSTPLEIDYGAKVRVQEFEASMDARDQFAAVKSSSWDSSTQDIIEGEGEDPGLDEQGSMTTADLSDVIGLEEYLLQHSGRVADDELKSWADAKLLRSRLAKIRGKVKIEGKTDVKPGDVIDIKVFGDRYNGIAFVSATGQRLTAGDKWYTDIEFGLEQDWFMNKYDNIQDKPAAGLLPAVNGLQIGIVTNIHEDPDGEERIRVRLPIIDKEHDGVWARLATLDAGDSRGSIFRPEVEDEVIVGFLNDDPRDPVILGMLHSSALPSPIPAAEENNEKGFITRGEIKLLFDDDLGSVTIETPNGNKITITDDEGAINIVDENDNKIEMTSDGVTVESAADLNIKAAGDINLEGTNINVTAQSQLKAEGSSGAEVSSSGQTVIKGSLVGIN
jgi:Rhs element Vgr protein